ncbi:MAG: putative toxin-antitoxin system toxin component, PIN family [Gammaproteobacteria bacterium]|nr:putative toxin-antitoxin system toxin component, PIN family [Gammaproteobacteria bacterium]MBU1733497.1 putative toxin-antitoxin system toxin component, PIN family [Gammaproteobacteria bacterium]MBU1891914.1 putative toxin-antitoxin system toxin component, PIN family [Gammaproteobacteria bacterium]
MPRAKRIPRVVIDTNLVLSTLVFVQGRLTPLRLAWQGAQCQPLLSSVTAAELIRVLAYPKFKLTSADQQELLADYLPYCTTVRMPPQPPATPDCRDKFDLPFLLLAVAGKADYLVTGDQDLLALDGQFVCPIITADQFMKTLNK